MGQNIFRVMYRLINIIGHPFKENIIGHDQYYYEKKTTIKVIE